jgi:hypothetical protein
MQSPLRAVAMIGMIGAALCTSARVYADLPAPDGKTSLEAVAKEFDLTPQLLSASQSGGGGDPLRDISQKMTGVHGDLSKYLVDQPVQEKEKKVIKSLDELIAALEKHCNGNGTGKGQTPNGGRKQSIIVKGDGRGGDLHAFDPRARNTIPLPPKERERILQSRTEGFPPGYEALLQSYYQQLAAEKSDTEKSADEKPAAPPTNPAAP